MATGIVILYVSLESHPQNLSLGVGHGCPTRGREVGSNPGEFGGRSTNAACYLGCELRLSCNFAPFLQVHRDALGMQQ